MTSNFRDTSPLNSSDIDAFFFQIFNKLNTKLSLLPRKKYKSIKSNRETYNTDDQFTDIVTFYTIYNVSLPS